MPDRASVAFRGACRRYPHITLEGSGGLKNQWNTTGCKDGAGRWGVERILA